MKNIFIAMMFISFMACAQEKSTEKVIVVSESDVDPANVEVKINGKVVKNVEVVNVNGQNGENMVFISENGENIQLTNKSVKMCEGENKEKCAEKMAEGKACCEEKKAEGKSCCEEKTNPRIIRMKIEQPDGPERTEYTMISTRTPGGSPEAFFWEGDDTNPLIYIDGKKASKEDLKKLDRDVIKKMKVFKGDEAIKKFGEEAKDGVIEITTRG